MLTNRSNRRLDSRARHPSRDEGPHAPEHETQGETSADEPLFENPFKLRDLLVFDDATLRELFDSGAMAVSVGELALATRGGPAALNRRLERLLTQDERARWTAARAQPHSLAQETTARRTLLNALFWELTYWKTPELYEELTAGERIHPGIWQRLGPEVRGKDVLDAGAGSGRATLALLRLGARRVYAVEPSPGLLRLLTQKARNARARQQILPLQGRFDALPLADGSVDVAVSCSAFTAQPNQGGDAGLAELKRVTRRGGLVVVIWPRPEDTEWFAERGFTYEALPVDPRMGVRFSSLWTAIRCARRFYARNPRVLHYLLRTRNPLVPYTVLGFHSPHDYCWLRVE